MGLMDNKRFDGVNRLSGNVGLRLVDFFSYILFIFSIVYTSI